MIRALHLFLMTWLTGAQLFTMVWVARSATCDSSTIMQLTLRQSLLLDKLAVVAILLLYLSGTLLVHPYGWQYTTPWILAAYGGLTLLSLLWWLQARLKWRTLRGAPFNLSAYRWLNGAIAFVLVISIKDAITKQSWF